ncbi:MAG: FliA/WhiG family RNA polymerase sigma factor [Anaerolineales bacterium]|nr:FliA/WhiG family RNA polymerase sigma factor [Anaerolineales bacterium]
MQNTQNDTEMLLEFHRNPTAEKRDAIILRYIPLVHFVLGRLGISKEYGPDYEDLVSYGLLGLIDAVDRYNPEFGTQFSTYATLRIRGQVLDFLRKRDWLSRAARQRARAVQEATHELFSRLRRMPTDEELAAYLNYDQDKLRQAMVDASRMIISIDSDLVSDGDNDGSLYEIVSDETQEDPSEILIEKDLKSRLMDALKELPEKDQLVLALYYNEGLTMREIGEVMEVSESRVCQIHARAAMNLKAKLSSQEGEGNVDQLQKKAGAQRKDYQLSEYQSQVMKSEQISGGGL